MTFRNEKTLYSRPCDLCKKNMISMYSLKVAFPVYCTDCFWSDKWDSAEYGMDLDLERPFFEQWEDMSALQAHFAVPDSQGFVASVADLALSPPVIKIFESTQVN